MGDVINLGADLDVGTAGGKGASLGQMLQAGFKVPPGFVITTGVNRLTEGLKVSIFKAFDGLQAKTVAVRSSAAAEDGKLDAWAGQMDSYLNVTRDKLLSAIQKCWDSSKSDRAQAYAHQKGLAAGQMAVVVQKMVKGDTSGVAFSAHPVTNNPAHMVIEAVEGLADKLVSGLVTPDNYVVSKDSLEVIEKFLAGELPKLGEEKIKELSQTVQKLEKYFGHAVDVEWTFLGKELFILQSRPITTLG